MTKCTYRWYEGGRSVRAKTCYRDAGKAAKFTRNEIQPGGGYAIVETYEPRCGQHVGAEKRKSYGKPDAIVEITPEIQAAWDRAAADARLRAESERVRADEQRAQQHQLYMTRRREEAARQWEAVRDDRVEPDLRSSGATKTTPRWHFRPVGEDRHWDAGEVEIAFDVDDAGRIPVLSIPRNSSKLDINAAEALVAALQEAIAEARKESPR